MASSETRDRLLAAAARAFAASGFAASTREIAGGAAANPALVAYHFGDKEGLWRAVVRDGLKALDARLSERSQAGGSPTALLSALGEQRDLARILLHEVVADSERSGWLLDRLGPLLRAVCARSETRDDLVSLSWLVSALSLSACGPALEAVLERRLTAEDRRAQVELLLRALDDRHPAAPGAWSIRAARGRRLGRTPGGQE